MGSQRVVHDWATNTFIIIQCPCYLFYVFVLLPILSDMNIASSLFLAFPFAWNILFHPFTFNLCVSFTLRWVFSRYHVEGSCFIIQSATLYLLMSTFSLLVFKIIIDNLCIYCYFKPSFPVHFVFLLYPSCFLFPFRFDGFLLYYSWVLFFWVFVNLFVCFLICDNPGFQVC